MNDLVAKLDWRGWLLVGAGVLVLAVAGFIAVEGIIWVDAPVIKVR